MFLISKSYQYIKNYINYVKIINIKFIQLKLLIFKKDLILMNIVKVFFIVKKVVSITNENISYDCVAKWYGARAGGIEPAGCWFEPDTN